MLNTKVPCGGFEIGNGLLDSGGVIDSSVKRLRVFHDSIGEWFLFKDKNYIQSYQELEKTYSDGITVVVENQSGDVLVCSTIGPIYQGEINGLGFNAIIFSAEKGTVTYSIVLVNEDFTLSVKDYTYTLAPST